MTKEIEETEIDSWNRFPKTKFRMRPEGLKQLIEGLGKDGFCRGGEGRITLQEDGVYIEFCANTGKYGDIQALGLEIFIPVDPADMPKEKPHAEEDEDTGTGPTTETRAESSSTEDIKMADDRGSGEPTERVSGLRVSNDDEHDNEHPDEVGTSGTELLGSVGTDDVGDKSVVPGV